MAVELYAFQCTIPAGTPASAPVAFNLAMPPRLVRVIDVRVPPGPNGLLGFALAAAGTPILPANRGSWVVTSDEAISWPVDGYLTTGAWQLQGYNTGLSPHTVYLRFQCDLLSSPAPASVSGAIPAAQLAPLTADDLAALSQAAPDLATAVSDTLPPPPADTLAGVQ